MKRTISALLLLCLCLSWASALSQAQEPGDAQPFGYHSMRADGLIYCCAKTEADGFTLFRMTEDEKDSDCLGRCRADGSDRTRITDQGIDPIGIQGDWLFAEIGGLNAEPVMLPKDGSADPVTVPGFGVYDCQAHKPESAEPEIQWNYESFGEGPVELYIASHELSACYRLILAESGKPAEEVLIARTGPYTGATLFFDPGRYLLKIAKGETWISDEAAFGPGGEYSAAEPYVFEANTYEIIPGVTGDFYQEDAAGFLK